MEKFLWAHVRHLMDFILAAQVLLKQFLLGGEEVRSRHIQLFPLNGKRVLSRIRLVNEINED